MFRFAIRLLPKKIAVLMVVESICIPCHLLLPQEGTFSKNDKHLMCIIVHTHRESTHCFVLGMLRIFLKQCICSQFFVTFMVNVHGKHCFVGVVPNMNVIVDNHIWE